jgi:hypothetical protein
MKTSRAVLLFCLCECTAKRDIAREGHSPDLPGMGVRLEMRDARPIVHADFNCGERARVQVHDIAFQDPTDPASVASPLCHLRARDDALSSYFPPAGWEYGRQLAGYVLSGPCLPLQAEHRYAVSVTGPGVGGVEFEVTADGGLRVVDDDCRPPSVLPLGPP